jgi:hypothetical protein
MSKKRQTGFTDGDFVIQPANPPVLDEQENPALVLESADAVGIVSMGDYVIEKVPIPGRKGRKGTVTFPIAALIPGTDDSFLVPSSSEKQAKVAGSIRTYAHRQGFKVVLRTEQSGVRVWRKNADKIK